MRLIAITGMRHQPKARFTRALIELLSADADRLALMDNSDVPLAIDGVTSQRLAGGRVCCSLAAALISGLGRLDADYALLPVSASADPGALASILNSLRSERIQITTVSMIDALTQIRNPYLTRKLESHSDIQVYEPFDFSEAVQDVMGLVQYLPLTPRPPLPQGARG